MGGSKPPGDSRINLLAVGAPFECPCHDNIHSGRLKLSRSTAIEIVAARERADLGEISEALWSLKRCTKSTTFKQLEEKGLLKWVIGGIGRSGGLIVGQNTGITCGGSIVPSDEITLHF
jgi:hypothetical protein